VSGRLGLVVRSHQPVKKLKSESLQLIKNALRKIQDTHKISFSDTQKELIVKGGKKKRSRPCSLRENRGVRHRLRGLEEKLVSRS